MKERKAAVAKDGKEWDQEDADKKFEKMIEAEIADWDWKTEDTQLIYTKGGTVLTVILVVVLCLVLWNRTGFKTVTAATGDSVYLFLAAKHPFGSVLAVLTASLQLRILWFFVGTDMNEESNQWEGLERIEGIGCIIAILCGNMLPEFIGAFRLLTSQTAASAKFLVERFDTEPLADFSAKSANFRGLVLSCIDAKFCK